jgi:hypothetical protein
MVRATLCMAKKATCWPMSSLLAGTRLYTHTHTHTHTQTYTHTNTHTHTHTVCTYTYMYIYIYICMYMHTHTHTLTHTHTHTQAGPPPEDEAVKFMALLPWILPIVCLTILVVVGVGAKMCVALSLP